MRYGGHDGWYGGYSSSFTGTLASGQFLGPDGSAAVPAYSYTLDPDTGRYRANNGQEAFTSDGVAQMVYGADVFTLKSTMSLGFASGNPAATAQDANVSRISAGVIGVGTGAAGSVAGTLRAATIVSTTASGGIGYTTGAGGTVTQATSKSTGVTLNTATGEITLNAAALAADTTVSFTLTNSAIAAADMVLVTHHSAGTAGSYTVGGQAAAGSATIWVRNVTAGSLSEAIVLKFAVLKGATS